VALAWGLIPGAVPAVEDAAARFTDHAAYATWVLRGAALHWVPPPPDHVSLDEVIYGVLSTLGALSAAAVGLFGRPLRRRAPAALLHPWLVALRGLRRLHSGHSGDYVAWWTAGAGALGAACLLVLR
jgi:multicomponent Na+:H+ antiporter subunit D